MVGLQYTDSSALRCHAFNGISVVLKHCHFMQNDRMAADMAVELRKENVACVSLWPGPVMTENVSEAISDPKDEKVAHKSVKCLKVRARTFAISAVTLVM